MRLTRKSSVVMALGLSQTVAWASSYYLPAMLATPMAQDLGTTTPAIFAAFSFAMLVSALAGPYAGRAIDHWGGRPVLLASNLLFALGLVLLAYIKGLTGLFIAWALLGLCMGSGLYEAAFASLVALYGRDSRSAISGITLIAGFASTVGWPLTSFLQTHFDWRVACWVWAGLHLALALPLNWLLPSPSAAATNSKTLDLPASQPARHINAASARIGVTLALSLVFAITWFISTVLAAHLPRLLMIAGVSFGAAVAASTLMGPAQVAARVLEFGLLRRVHPLLSARLAALAHPVGAMLLLWLGAPLALVFVILHGAGNGVLTIAKGTLPLVLFGPHGYGARQGLLMVPARIAQAFAPWLFGLCLDRWGLGALWVSAALGAISLAMLLALQRPSSVP
jgi:predicted MFS family arabinose efflux permease